MMYLVIAVALFTLELFYFRLAKKFHITDVPNHRSSHNQITIRGGGVIFPIAAICFFLTSGLVYPHFTAGLILISFISFWDDVTHLSNRVRIIVHLAAISLLFFQAGLFNFNIWMIIAAYILVTGAINAYNFMDGINGITGLYSFTGIATLAYVNTLQNFIDQRLLIIMLLALVVFLFFNFRTQAKCFAGDVGSISIAFILLFALLMLLLKSGQWIVVMFLAVYGTDAVLTILHRMLRKENIFKPHRSHLYQLLSNEAGKSHLTVSIAYASVQILINSIVLCAVNWNPVTQFVTSVVIFGLLISIYQIIRNRILLISVSTDQGAS